MKSIISLALICLAAMSELALARNSNQDEWLEFKNKYGKVYDTAEEDAQRFSLFMETKERVEQHNADKNNSYKLGLNYISDWTLEERATLTGVRLDQDEHMGRVQSASENQLLQEILNAREPVPDALDWRQVPDRVSSVQNPVPCGSCWAFATTGVLEGQQVVRGFTTELVPLSEQQLVDCTVGCQRGSYVSSALEYIKKTGGIMSEADYPYVGANSTCRFDRRKIVMTVSGSFDLPQGDEEILKVFVARFGPVATVLNANTKLFDYTSSVLNDPSCNPFTLNHAVLIVGYGKDPVEGDYWIVKNSWGEHWGDKGYFKIKRGTGMCGIGKWSTIPTFD